MTNRWNQYINIYIYIYLYIYIISLWGLTSLKSDSDPHLSTIIFSHCNTSILFIFCLSFPFFLFFLFPPPFLFFFFMLFLYSFFFPVSNLSLHSSIHNYITQVFFSSYFFLSPFFILTFCPPFSCSSSFCLGPWEAAEKIFSGTATKRGWWGGGRPGQLEENTFIETFFYYSVPNRK